MTVTAASSPCPSEDLVARFCAWGCSDTERAQVEAHADECDDCRRLLGELARELSLPGAIASARTTEPHAGRDARGPGLARATIVGRMVVLDVIGAGGMGVVYAAYDPELDRKVAIKLLHAGAGDREASARARARILREAQAMARLQHENLIAIYDVGTFRDGVFLAMELSEGTTLAGWLQRQRRSWREVVDTFASAGRGLVAAHEGGILHLDFKPANVLIREDGQIKVTDFGLSRAAPRGDEPAPSGPARVAGTPRYMAPEQRAGGPVDERTDQYAFCVALYEALYGTHPRGLAGGPIAAARGRAPAWLRGVVSRGLQEDPARRHESMRALLQRLRPTPRRRLAWVAALAGTAVAAAGFAFVVGGEPRDLCRAPVAKFAGIWDPATREVVRAGFLRTGVPYAGDAWKQTSAALDRHRDRWLVMHTRTCEATHVSGEQSAELLDLRMQCLDDRLGELRQLVHVLRAPDAGVIAQAGRATAALGDLAECADAAGLRASVPAPRDPQARARVTEIHGLLATARALRDTARYREGVDVADTAVQWARAVEQRPALAEALYWQGALRVQAGDYAGAEAAFGEGGREALAGGQLRVAARILVELVAVLGVSQSHHEQATQWSPWARAAIAGSGGDPPLLARLMRYEGLVLVGQGQRAAGLARLREALAAHERLTRAAPLDLAALHTDLGQALDRMGQLGEALQHHQRAREITERELGPAHPTTIGAQYAIASVLTGKGDFAAGRALLVEVLAGFERTLGPQHANTGKTQELLATVSIFEGKYEEALTWSGRAEAIAVLTHGRDSVEAAATMAGRALVLEQLGRLAEAEAIDLRVLAIYEEKLGPGHPDVARALLSLGTIHTKRGDYPRAREYLQRSVDIMASVPGVSALELAGHLGFLADVQRRAGEYGPALASLERAQAVVDGSVVADHPDVAMLVSNKADVLLALGRCEEARVLFQRAHDIDLAKLGEQHHQLAARRTELGKALLCLDRPAEAVAGLERALVVLQGMPVESCELGEAQFTLARTLARLGQDPPRVRALARAAAELYAASGGQCRELAGAGEWSPRAG